MEKKKMNCPSGHGAMKIINKRKSTTFKGVDISYSMSCFVCPVCGLEAGTLSQAADIQKTIADAYRKKAGLMTGREMIEGRKKLDFTQQKLANMMKVGIASIK